MQAKGFVTSTCLHSLANSLFRQLHDYQLGKPIDIHWNTDWSLAVQFCYQYQPRNFPRQLKLVRSDVDDAHQAIFLCTRNQTCNYVLQHKYKSRLCPCLRTRQSSELVLLSLGTQFLLDYGIRRRHFVRQ